MNKENLLKIADYIETIPQESFDMEIYTRDDNQLPKCNSVGCIVGHCTALDSENVSKNYTVKVYENSNRITYLNWSQEFTGLYAHSGLEWDWCFGYLWSTFDNTPKGAAKRIRYLVENGLPLNAIRQIKGKDPLCYI